MESQARARARQQALEQRQGMEQQRMRETPPISEMMRGTQLISDTMRLDAERAIKNRESQDAILQQYLSTPITRPQDVSQSTMKVKAQGGSGAPE